MSNKLWKTEDGIRFTDKLGTSRESNNPNDQGQPISQLQDNNPRIKPGFDLTPVKRDTPLFTETILTRNDIWSNREDDGIDRVALHGFTIPELIDLGALAATKEETNIQANNLEGDVHPAFSIDKWETRVPAHFTRKEFFPLGLGSDGLLRPGSYTGNNLFVWKALLPCLRLASKFLVNAHLFPWYMAFLHSDIYPVADTISGAEQLTKTLRKLHLPRQSDMNNADLMSDTAERIAEISKHVRLGISDGTAEPTGAKPDLKLKYDGVAIPPWKDDKRSYRIYISYQTIAPLLEDIIGPSTRLALQFHVALTLLHEFAHVLEYAKTGSPDIKLYLDDERISEAGSSFEMNTFGGHPVLLLQDAESPDYNGSIRAGFILEDWLGTSKAHQWIKPLSGTDADWNDREWRESRSIPISFLEELGQEDFWRCFVARWGAEVLKVSPWTEGRLVRRLGDALETQIYLAPRQEPAWLKAAQQFSHTKRGTLSPKGIIAMRMANRRISRENEINALVRTRRKLEEQERKRQNEKARLPEPNPNDDQSDDPLEDDSQPTAVVVKSGDLKPWEERAENVEALKELLDEQARLCSVENERVRTFLDRKDIGSPDYLATQTVLMDANTEECKSFRMLAQAAFDDELLEGYENILENYETMKDQLKRISRQTSEERIEEDLQEVTNTQCRAWLKVARGFRDGGEDKKACDQCELILSKDHVSPNLNAGANFILGLSTADLEWKVWYLSEAVRMYGLVEHFEGEFPREVTISRKLQAEVRLAEAKALLEASKEAAAKTLSTRPEVVQPRREVSSPKTPPNPNGPRFTAMSPAKKSKKAFAGFGNPPSDPPSPLINYDPAPRDMPSSEVMRHRRTFKVINQARQNFFNGDYSLAERGFLELLNLQGTSEWQKARCHVFLASIHTRRDRAERAKSALKMYKTFLEKWPEDERCIVAVKEAEKLVQSVLTEIEGKNTATSEAEKKPGNLMSGGLGIKSSDSNAGHSGVGLDTITEGEEESKSAPRRRKHQEQVSFVAGVIEKVCSILNLKRRRNEEDGDENEKINRVRRTRVT